MELKVNVQAQYTKKESAEREREGRREKGREKERESGREEVSSGNLHKVFS